MSKRERKGVALCQPYDSKYIKPNQQYFIDPKLNGVRCKTIINHNRDVYMFSSTEKPINSVPHLEAQLIRLVNSVEKQNFPIVLDGELYIHGESFQKINSKVSRTVNLHPEHETVNYYIFDMLYPNGDNYQVQRYLDLSSLFDMCDNNHDNLYNVSNMSKIFEGSDILENLGEITSLFYKQKFEGIVIKDVHAVYEPKRLKTWLKYKPRKQDTYKVINIQQEVDKNGNLKNSMGSLQVTGLENNTINFYVGSGFTKKDREHIWSVFKETGILPNTVVVKYQELSDGQIPVFPIAWSYNYQ